MIKKILLTVMAVVMLTAPNDANALTVFQYKEICMRSGMVEDEKIMRSQLIFRST